MRIPGPSAESQIGILVLRPPVAPEYENTALRQFLLEILYKSAEANLTFNRRPRGDIDCPNTQVIVKPDSGQDFIWGLLAHGYHHHAVAIAPWQEAAIDM